MMSINPFATLSETVPSILLQGFVLVMLGLIFFGTIIQMIHHKNITYFFNNAKKAKLSAEKELGIGKRRVAHVLGMWGTILFWISSAVMIFCYTSANSITPNIWPMMWHIGAIMTCIGGYWFWLFLRVDVLAEAHPWYRIIKADLFVLTLLACATFGLAWSYTQSLNLENRWDDQVFLTLYIVSNLSLIHI